MRKPASVEEFGALRRRILADREARPARPTLVLSAGICGQASGANDLMRVVKRHLLSRNLTDRIALRVTGCQGFCQMDPSIVVEPGNHLYPKLKMEHVPRIIEATLGGFVAEETAQAYVPSVSSGVVTAAPVACILPMAEEMRETYLVIRLQDTQEIVTVLETLSPSNKRPGGDGRVARHRGVLVLHRRRVRPLRRPRGVLISRPVIREDLGSARSSLTVNRSPLTTLPMRYDAALLTGFAQALLTRSGLARERADAVAEVRDRARREELEVVAAEPVRVETGAGRGSCR